MISVFYKIQKVALQREQPFFLRKIKNYCINERVNLTAGANTMGVLV